MSTTASSSRHIEDEVRLVEDRRPISACFYDEKADAVYVDGERQKRPITPWS